MLRQHERTKSLKDRCYGPETDRATAGWGCRVEAGTARDQELSGVLYDQADRKGSTKMCRVLSSVGQS